MIVRRYTDAERAQWDDLIGISKNSHFMFERAYMEYHSNRFDDFSLVLAGDDGVFRAVLPGNLSDRTLFSHQGLTFGGLCVRKDATTALVLDMFKCILEFLGQTGLVDRLVYKRVPDFYASYPAQEDLYALFVLNASLVRRDVSVTIDLESPLGLSAMRLRRVQKAKQYGVKVQEAASLAEYWDLLGEVLLVRHGEAPVHSLSEMESLQRIFPDRIRCFVAIHNDEVIAGTVIYETQLVAHAQYLASGSLGRDLGGLDLVIYDLIMGTYSQKRFFNLGISTEDEGRTLNTGLISHKEGFGARAFVHDFYSLPITPSNIHTVAPPLSRPPSE